MSVGNYTHTLPAGFGACAVSSVNSARFLPRLVKKEIYGGIFYGKKSIQTAVVFVPVCADAGHQPAFCRSVRFCRR